MVTTHTRAITTIACKSDQWEFSVLILFQNTHINQLVRKLLHGVQSGDKTLRGHDYLPSRFLTGFFAFMRGQPEGVYANHAPKEVNLLKSINKLFRSHL